MVFIDVVTTKLYLYMNKPIFRYLKKNSKQYILPADAVSIVGYMG